MAAQGSQRARTLGQAPLNGSREVVSGQAAIRDAGGSVQAEPRAKARSASGRSVTWRGPDDAALARAGLRDGRLSWFNGGEAIGVHGAKPMIGKTTFKKPGRGENSVAKGTQAATCR